MRPFRFAAAVLALIAFAGTARAQVSIAPDPPPLGAVKLSAFWNGTLTQSGTSPVTARVRVTVRAAGGETVFDALSGTRDFPAGTHRLSSLSLEPLTVSRVAPSVETALMRTGALPDGRYTLCLEAVDAGGGSLAPAACVDVEIASVLPPMPMEPPNGGATSDPFIVWTWFMQPTTAAGEEVACDLVVVEILGAQTPEEAMRKNPPVLVREKLRSSAWQTNDAVRQLRPDQSYAWKLIAKVGDRVAAESEIWTFTYLAPEIVDGPVERPVEIGAGSTPAVPLSAPPANPVSAAVPPAAPAAAAALTVAAAPKPIEWHAVARATARSSNRQGALAKEPSDYARLELDPTLSIYGSPLALNLLLSTERDPRESEIQRGTLAFDQARGIGLAQRIEGRTQQLRRSRDEMLADTLRLVRDDLERLDREMAQLQALKLQEPSQATRELEQLGLVSATEATAMRIPAFAFGSVAPDHGRLTLNGVTMNGGMVELQPGRWHAELAAGKLTRVDDFTLALPTTPQGTRPELFQDLYSARLGFGHRTANHLFLTGLYARDDRQSEAIMALAQPGKPAPVQENIVLGIAGRARGRKNTLVLDGDLQTSLYNDDRNAPALRNLAETGGLRRLFGSSVRENSAVDWSGALRGSADLAGGRTRLLSSVRFVGPGYQSAGVRNLRRDNLQIDGGFEQKLGTRLSLATQFGQDRTGVVIPESGFGRIERVSSRLSGQLAKLPAFDAVWNFNVQTQRPGGATRDVRNRSNLGSLRLRQGGRLGAARSLTTLAGDWIVATSNDVTGAHSSTNAQLSQMFSLPSRVGFLGRLSKTRTRTALADGPEADVWAWEGSANYAMTALVSGSLGVTGARSSGLAQAGGFVGATFGLGPLGAVDLGWSFNNARSRQAGVRGFLDRTLRVQLLSRGAR